MKKRMIFYFIMFIAVMFSVSCHLISSKTETFTVKDTEKTIYVNLKDSFNVSLDSNPTTGYSWEILPYNESVIRFAKSKYRPNTDRIGSNGKRIIEFKAFGKGKTILELFYLRVWKNDKGPINKFKITVVVE